MRSARARIASGISPANGGSSFSAPLPSLRARDGEGDEGAADMVDADERRVRDDVEALLATIVGMRPPADVGEDAGGLA